MTEHEDLIAEANENLHKAADAAPASARQAILTGKVEDQRMSLIARLKHALEQVTTERDALAAVVERANGWATMRVPGFSVENQMAEVADALNAAPPVALDRVKAEALREAADDYVESGREQSFGVTSVLMFLYDRADGIEKGEGND